MGLYVLYFLSIYKININNLYDRSKNGFLHKNEIKNVNECNENELFLILNEERYSMILNNLCKIIPNSNVYTLK